MSTSDPPKICQISGHENQKLIPYLCVSKYCDLNSRYVCTECLVDNLHHHNGLKPKILSQNKFLASFEQDVSELKQKNQSRQEFLNQKYNETLKIIIEIEGIIQTMKSILQQCSKKPDDDQSYFQSLSTLIKEQFFTLSSDNIARILSISDHQLNGVKIEKINTTFLLFLEKSEELKSLIKSKGIQSDLDFNISIEQIKKVVYSEESIHNLIQNVKGYGSTLSKISSNNRYLALVRSNLECFSKLTNWGSSLFSDYKYFFDFVDLKQKRSKKLRFKNTKIEFLQFSRDSQILYYKESNEPFCCYDIKNEQTTEYFHFPELLSIQFFLSTRWNRAFILNKASQIQLLDLEFQYVLFESKIKNGNKLINDEMNKAIISSGDILEFWKEDDGNKIYEFQLQSKLENIKLHSYKGVSKLLASQTDHICIFQIQYNDDIIKVNEIQKFKHDEKIVSFSQVLNEQYFIIFGQYGSVKIYDEKFIIMKHIFIGSEDDRKSKQFDMCECSNDLSAITVISSERNKCLYLTWKNQYINQNLLEQSQY